MMSEVRAEQAVVACRRQSRRRKDDTERRIATMWCRWVRSHLLGKFWKGPLQPQEERGPSMTF